LAPRSKIRNPERKRQTTHLLLEVSNRLAQAKTLDEAIDMLVQFTVNVVGVDRGSIFLNDPANNELYTRIAQGKFRRELRMLNNTGIAGEAFSTAQAVIIHDAYSDPRFNRSVDEQTGYKTHNILCVPLRTLRGEVIGVAELINKKEGDFNTQDLRLVDSMVRQAAIALESHRTIENVERTRLQEKEFLNLITEIASEIKLGPLLQRLIGAISAMLGAERSTLFLNDEKTQQLYTLVGEGLGATEIRFPNHVGIAGAVFTSRKALNIPYAYADLRFNPGFDRQTGFFTRSMLCVPVSNKDGKIIGVTQVLNKHGGAFNQEDETRLRAFTSEIAIALENAKLFDDVQNMKNYNDSVLESMSSAVITLDENEVIETCNSAALRILKVQPSAMLKRSAKDVFVGDSAWIIEKVSQVEKTQHGDVTIDASVGFGQEAISANVTVLPLVSGNAKKLGSLIMIDDITSEKRMKSTMARYMDPSIADRLLQTGTEILGGQSSTATVLFSDIRGFTTLTEEFGPQATVSLLNEYFTLMVDCIQLEGGMLDKFIGDAIMAVFGVPITREDDADRAVRTAIAMMHELNGYNYMRRSEAKKPIDIGVGINTDTVVSGNIGSPKRMDYTVIGDGVNLASRLESACKEYRAHILISENTYRKLRGTYRLREIDRVVVKGKTQPVAIHEVLDYHEEDTFPNIMGVLTSFHAGITAYRLRRWDDAAAAFRDALRLNPDDYASSLWLDRCAHMKINPPAEEWQGEWVMKAK
jgi:adenylate cyclase